MARLPQSCWPGSTRVGVTGLGLLPATCAVCSSSVTDPTRSPIGEVGHSVARSDTVYASALALNATPDDLGDDNDRTAAASTRDAAGAESSFTDVLRCRGCQVRSPT